jgi:HemY protein
MVRLLSIFIILLASVWLGVALQQDPGYLLIAIHHWTIETTLVVAMIGLVLVFIFLHLLLLLIQWVIHLPHSWKEWLARQRAYNARAKTRQGLIEFSEGYWSQAKNHLIKALPDTDTPLLNYLTAARAAQEMGDSKLRDDYLRQAQQSMPEAKIAVELTQAQLQLANRQWEQALATLRHLQDLAPHHPYVLKLLMHLYEEVKDWPQLIALLPELKRNHVISDDEYQRLQQHAYYQAMLDLIKQGHDKALEKFMKSLPPRLNENTEIIAQYGRYLLKSERLSEAELLLRRSLRKQFDENLLSIYGQINYTDNQLNFAESLLKEHPHSAALCLCLGRLSKHKNLWGKAKIYFEQSIEFGATPLAYLELGKLLEQLSDQAGACAAYQRGLALAIDG